MNDNGAQLLAYQRGLEANREEYERENGKGSFAALVEALKEQIEDDLPSPGALIEAVEYRHQLNHELSNELEALVRAIRQASEKHDPIEEKKFALWAIEAMTGLWRKVRDGRQLLLVLDNLSRQERPSEYLSVIEPILWRLQPKPEPPVEV